MPAVEIRVLHAPEFRVRSVKDVPWGTHDLRLVLQRTPPLPIEVVDDTGAPVEEFGVVLLRDGTEERERGTVLQRGVHAGGRLDVRGVDPGRTSLRVVPIEIPPLRRRREDIPLLVEHILGSLAGKGLPRFQVEPEAMKLLERYPWPGNVRELRNLLEQLVVLGGPDAVITVRDLPPHLVAPPELSEGSPSMPWQFGRGGIDFYREMEAIEDRIIAQALRLSGGNKKEAARLLRVNRTTLLEKLKRKRAQGGALAAFLAEHAAPGLAVPASSTVAA